MQESLSSGMSIKLNIFDLDYPQITMQKLMSGIQKMTQYVLSTMKPIMTRPICM